MKNLKIDVIPIVFAIVVAIVAFLVASSCTPSMAHSENLTAYLDQEIPDFELADFAGEMVSKASLKGKYVVLHIATTWCPYCNAEAPHLEQIYQEYQDKGVEVLIIDVKEERELVKKLLIDRFNLSFPILMDEDGAVAASFAPADVLPELARDEVMLASNLLIDPEGKIKFFSLLDTYNFDAELKELKAVLDASL